MCFGWTGNNEDESLSYSANAREIVKVMQVGAVILFERNLQPPYIYTAELINELQAASKLPLLIPVDQEGGNGCRFNAPPFTVFPFNAVIGATGSEDYARKAAQVTAEELKAVGVNYDLAPVTDVNSNPNNPIIGPRSFGESSELVSRFAAAAIAGYQESGVIACAKHFPGHGDTSKDSHLELPTVDRPRSELETVELVPFSAAIRAGVDSIMTAHVIYPALDASLPATLSKAIITELLRGEMGFREVVITDCLEMKAISENYGIGEAALMAIHAGADILLACHTLSRQREIYETVLRAAMDGVIEESRINKSVDRILTLKQKYRLDDRRKTDVRKVPELLGKPEHIALLQEIVEKANRSRPPE